MLSRRLLLAFLLVGIILTSSVSGQDKTSPPSAERGRKIMQTRAFNTATWSTSALDKAWRYWDADGKGKPENYRQAILEHYGLHAAPFDSKYPLGLREGRTLLGGKGLTTDCMLCHGGSILGKSYIGLGNSTLDIHALFSDLDKASGRSGKLPFTFSNVRGTTEAAAFAVFLMAFREPDLTLRLNPRKVELHTDMCEDVPAWWLLKKKKSMYFTGATPAKSVRSIMQFMLASTKMKAGFEAEEPHFREIQAYILSLEPPKYPFPIDHKLANKGKKIFRKTCSTCHGTYGKNWTYPNKIVPIEVIGTDRRRFDGLPAQWAKSYNESWFAKEKKGPKGFHYQVRETKGYQAPPLDGIWATAPYFHNGSVPTIHNVLNSTSRPKIFTRSYCTDTSAYDKKKVGWKVQILKQGATADMTPFQRRKIYDTRQPGRSNQGHTFGDDLSEAERRAVIEYLKTL